jgi:4-hydroxy-tetrahydrodipicolinate synthase
MIRGIWAAVPTPVDVDLAPDPDCAVAFYRDLLREGCDGIHALGTTGEAMSFGAAERERFMEALAESGIPADRMMAGTGAASLDAAARLTRHAIDCGFAAALVMPPFFFRDAADEGIVRFFDALFARAAPPPARVLLYNFPRMSGITFSPELVDRLLELFPGTIAGMKDSSNDVRLQREILARHPEFAMLPGSEGDLLEAKERGVAGCISATVALWPQLAAAVFTGNDEVQAAELSRRRRLLETFPMIPALRHLIAARRGESQWERAMPPQTALPAAQARALEGALAL